MSLEVTFTLRIGLFFLISGFMAAIIPMPWKVSLPSSVRILSSTLSATYWTNWDVCLFHGRVQHFAQSGVLLGMSSRSHDGAVNRSRSVMQNDDVVAHPNQLAVVSVILVAELPALLLVQWRLFWSGHLFPQSLLQATISRFPVRQKKQSVLKLNCFSVDRSTCLPVSATILYYYVSVRLV